MFLEVKELFLILKLCKKIAKETGYPVMLKATAGGGGKGMRGVWKEEDLKDAWDSASQESKAAFGNDDMYMEKLIEEPRHIEIQIVGDSTGRGLSSYQNVIALYNVVIKN